MPAWTAEDEAELKAIEKEALEASDDDDQDGGLEGDQPDTETPDGEEPEEGTEKKDTPPDSSTGKEEKKEEEEQSEDDGLSAEDKDLINNPNLSRRTRKRLSDLSKKAKEVDKLQKELADLRAGKKPEAEEAGDEEEDIFEGADKIPTRQQPKDGKMPWEEKDELSVDDVRGMARKEAADVIAEENERQSFANSIKQDCQTVVEKYPVLNDESDQYNPEIDKMIARGYQVALQSYPRLRFAKYVKVEMKAIQSAIEKSQTDLKATLTQQGDDQALPANGSTPKGGSKLTPKDLDNMSMEEMERALPKASNYDTY